MTLSSDFNALYDQMVATDRRMARRVGEHLDTTMQLTKQLRETDATPTAPALPTSTPADFTSINDADLKKLLKAYGVKGYTQRNGKRLRKADRVALAIEHNVPPLSYSFLLDQYLRSVR